MMFSVGKPRWAKYPSNFVVSVESNPVPGFSIMPELIRIFPYVIKDWKAANAKLCGNFGTAKRWKNCPATALG